MNLSPAANDYSAIVAFGLPVRWDTSRRERILHSQEMTWPAVTQLLEQTATAFGRSSYLEERVEGVERPLIRLSLDSANRRVITETSDLRWILLNDRVHRAMRAYVRGTMARIIRRRDFTAKGGKAQSEIIVSWDVQSLPPSRQLKALNAALVSQDPFRIEAAWFGLTGRSHEYLTVGFRVAHRLRLFLGFCDEPEASAQIISVLMPSAEVLRVVVPFALRMASRPGRRRVHDRDEALDAVLNVVADVAGTDDPMAWKPRRDEPAGPGADFVRRVEAIFTVELMPPGSTHAPRRAYTR